MSEPKRTDRATEANRRRGDETAAARLRAHGWLVIPPEARTDLKENVMTPMWTLEFSARTIGAAYDLARQAQLPGKLALGVSEGGRLGYEATGSLDAVKALQGAVSGETYLTKH